jgi:cytochrome c-type biogenesis protein CcmH/NrfG
MKSRDFVAANRAFGRATKLQPEEWEYLAYYGYSIHLSKPDDEKLAKKARLVLRDAINLAGDHEKPYLFMARICQASGHFDSAQKMFMRAVVIQPSCVEAQRELRLLDMRIRKSKKGILGRLIGS